MPVAAVMAIASVASAGASIAGTIASSRAQKKAANNALQYQQQIRSDVQPYLTAGTNALGMISDPNKLAANFTSSPGYQFALQQGQNAVLQNKAMNGLLRSGGAIKSLDAYTVGQADQDFNNWWNQQYDIANLGKSAESIAAGVADNSSNISLNQGANQGNAAIQMGNNVGDLAGSLSRLIGNNAGGSASSYAAPGAGFGSGPGMLSNDPGAANYFPF